MASATQLQELRQILKSSVGRSPQENLYQHLTDTLLKLLLEKSPTSYEAFDVVSSQLKANPLRVESLNGSPLPADSAHIESQLLYGKKVLELVKVSCAINMFYFLLLISLSLLLFITENRRALI